MKILPYNEAEEPRLLLNMKRCANGTSIFLCDENGNPIANGLICFISENGIHLRSSHSSALPTDEQGYVRIIPPIKRKSENDY